MATPWDFHLLATRQAHLPHIDTVLAQRLRERELATPRPSTQQPPTTTTPPSARDEICAARVANTLELAELILAHLPPIDLVRCTRVNHPFRNLIHTSPTLQRKLFLRAPKPSTPVEQCQFVQWGPGLEQRHIMPLPHPSVVDDVAIEARAKPLNKAFQEMMTLYRPAVKMGLLCPLLEVAELTPSNPTHWDFNWRWAFPAPPGSHGPVETTARFRGKSTLVPVQPYTAASAQNGATAVNSSSSSTTTMGMAPPPPRFPGWAYMQLSAPPTHHAHLKLIVEGRFCGSLRVILEAKRCMQRSTSSPGITVHELVSHACAAIGSVAVEAPVWSRVDFRWEEKWVRTVREVSTLAACMAEAAQGNPWVGWEWRLGANSEVTLRGVVVPTEGELERLTESGWLSSTPVPLLFELKEPGAEEDEDQDDQEGGDDEADDADDEGEDQGDQGDDEDVSESGSVTPTQ